MNFTNSENSNIICITLIVLLLVSAQALSIFFGDNDGIYMGSDINHDITRSDEGRPLSEAIIDFKNAKN
jgi:hypothetical protein